MKNKRRFLKGQDHGNKNDKDKHEELKAQACDESARQVGSKKEVGTITSLTFKRDGDVWLVTRRRADTGESARCSSLEECFDFVRAAFREVRP